MISALRIRFWGSFLRSSLPFFPGGPSPMASVLYTRGRFKQTNYPGFPQNFLKFREFSPCPPLVTLCLTIKYPANMGFFAVFYPFSPFLRSFSHPAVFPFLPAGIVRAGSLTVYSPLYSQKKPYSPKCGSPSDMSHRTCFCPGESFALTAGVGT